MRRALACGLPIAAFLACATPMLAQEGSNSGNTLAPSLASAGLSPAADLKIGKKSAAAVSVEETAAAANKVVSITSSPPITLVVKADLTEQLVTVLEGDVVVHVWPISSGLRDYPTPKGVFRPQSANRMWYSRQYNWTPMPYAVFFTRGVAFHGTNATSRLGKSASHGCVRLATSDAEQLFALVHKHGFDQTRIMVYGTPRHDAPAVAGRAPAVRNETTASNRLPSWAAAAFNR